LKSKYRVKELIQILNPNPNTNNSEVVRPWELIDGGKILSRTACKDSGGKTHRATTAKLMLVKGENARRPAA
jgi:hypothetical protein